MKTLKYSKKFSKFLKGPGGRYLSVRKGEGAGNMDDRRKSVIVIYRKIL